MARPARSMSQGLGSASVGVISRHSGALRLVVGLALAWSLFISSGTIARACIYSDGSSDVLNDASCISTQVNIVDSTGGANTLLTVQSPADLGIQGQNPYSISMLSRAGGHPELDFQGGQMSHRIGGGGLSCVTISGGTIGSQPESGDVQGVGALDISGGTFTGNVEVPSRGRTTISGGSIHRLGPIHGQLRMTGGMTTDRAEGKSGGHMIMVGPGPIIGTNASGISVYAWQSSRAHLHAGTYTGGLSAAYGGRISVTGGSVGANDQDRSVNLYDSGNGLASGHLTGGTYSGGVYSGGRGYTGIRGGSFGANDTGNSIDALNFSVVEIHGGSFAGPFVADETSVIHIYGQGLSLLGDNVVGTLGDGTPINILVQYGTPGSLQLHETHQELPSVPVSASLLEVDQAAVRIPGSVTLSGNCSSSKLSTSTIPMTGNSFGTFDLGSGPVGVGNASAILRRDAQVIGPPSEVRIRPSGRSSWPCGSSARNPSISWTARASTSTSLCRTSGRVTPPIRRPGRPVVDP